MRYTIPHYYCKFQCTAGDCPDTCCAGWKIVIDKKTLKKYKNMEGPFGNRVRNSIDWEEETFLQYDRRCAFLNEENLCDIYTEAGEKMFCKTCRLYPRHIEEFQGQREISLSLSCVEAGKLILGCKEPVKFVSIEKDVPEREDETFDFLLYGKLWDTREAVFHILQNRDLPIRLRLSMVLALAHDVEVKVGKQQLFQVDDVLERYTDDTAPKRFEKKLEQYIFTGRERKILLQKMWAVFEEFEVLNQSWTPYVNRLEKIVFGQSAERYEENRKRFSEEILEKEVWTEQLMIYFVFTYFCGAVYDGAIYAKMQLAVVSTLLIEELAMAVWRENGFQLSFMEFVDIAHKYSRELEHSDINLNCLEEIVKKWDCFRLENLLRTINERA